MQIKKEYFAGANTRNGFVSCFNEMIEKKFKKIYILKGSAGCGKSTFMKKVGEKAFTDGYSVEYIRCSADSSSIDGVLIPELSLCVLDGTAPHIMNVKYPSARDNIINLGMFWNEKKLKNKREDIIVMIDKKSVYFDNAYRAISAAASIRDIRKELIFNSVLVKKLEDYAERLFGKLIKHTVGKSSLCLQSAFNSKGFETLNTFSEAKNIYYMDDKYDLAPVILKKLLSLAEHAEVQCVYSYDPLDFNRLCALYFPAESILFCADIIFVPDSDKINQNRPINTGRFIDKNKYALIRQKDRAAQKLYNSLLDSARIYLAEAQQTHYNLENIYINAVDFGQLNDYTNKFIKNIFGE